MKHRTRTRGRARHTVEEFACAGDLLQIEIEIDFAVEPYDPGYRYDRNGDGCPPSGGGVEDFVVRVTSAVGAERDYAAGELPEIERALNAKIDADADLAHEIRQICEDSPV